MKYMLVLMFTISSVFALDEYLPLEPKTVEVDVGYGYFPFTGFYDQDGEKQDLPAGFGDPATSQIPIQLKYGIITGLDVELLLSYIMMNEDAGDVSGLDNMNLGVKYATPAGIGGFLDLTLPFGSEDIVGTDPAMAIKLGGMYGGLLGPINLLANLYYQMIMADGSDVKFNQGDIFGIFLKPEFVINEMLGAYLLANWEFAGEDEDDFFGKYDNAGNLLTLAPGVNAKINDMVALEANVPFSVMGKNAGAGWGFQLLAYFTFGL